MKFFVAFVLALATASTADATFADSTVQNYLDKQKETRSLGTSSLARGWFNQVVKVRTARDDENTA
ncbi:hypothetical protein LQW54_004082 [Pestalotiopsis sp. IQ-011]